MEMDRSLEHLGTEGLSDLLGQEKVTVAVERSGQGYQLRITNARKQDSRVNRNGYCTFIAFCYLR